jgi:hypothetical protein
MAKEGLAYCLARRDFGPLPLPKANEKDISDDFLRFCLKGLLGSDKKPIEAPDHSGQMTGTLNWLASLFRFDAKFYVAHKPALMFFVSLDDGTNPWSKMPGFKLLILKEDLTLDLHTTMGQFMSGEFILEPRPDLDEALAKMRHPLEIVSSSNKKRLIAALRGDPGTDLKQTLDEIEAAEGIGLRDLIEERVEAFETQLAAQVSAKAAQKKKLAAQRSAKAAQKKRNKK